MFTRIVVGTDGSDTAAEAVRQAIDLAKSDRGDSQHRQRLRAGLETAHPGRVRGRARRTSRYEIGPREDVNLVLDAAAAKARAAGIEVQTHPVQADPADAILNVAEEINADLIVVGNKGMTGARRYLLGSVPNNVSHHAPCSVIIVRTT